LSACVAIAGDPIPADVTIAPVGGEPMFLAGQSFNRDERTVDVTVTSGAPLTVTSMRLGRLAIAGGNAVVTARIYNAAGALIAFAATVIGPGPDQDVEIPVEPMLLMPGQRYRVGFLVDPDVPGAGSATLFDPRENLGFPYDADPAGRLRVEIAQLNGNPIGVVPIMRVQ
jgi:hypothetical protein